MLFLMENVVSGPSLSFPKDTRFRRRLFYIRHLLKRTFLFKRGYRLANLGERSTGCSWTFCPDRLGPTSIVYSGGVGRDVTFEHALVQKFGCVVFLLDPSPTGLTTMNLPDNQIPQFRFSPVGLAGQSGTLRLAPPLADAEGSWFSHPNAANAVEAPCFDLATLLRQNGHTRINLLKLDIEGAEYGVIDQILRERIQVDQILVEFHDGLLPGVHLTQSLRALFRLLARGYHLLAEEGNNHTFLWARSHHVNGVEEAGAERRPG
jgi:FkbM family methyltransferase